MNEFHEKLIRGLTKLAEIPAEELLERIEKFSWSEGAAQYAFLETLICEPLSKPAQREAASCEETYYVSEKQETSDPTASHVSDSEEKVP